MNSPAEDMAARVDAVLQALNQDSYMRFHLRAVTFKYVFPVSDRRRVALLHRDEPSSRRWSDEVLGAYLDQWTVDSLGRVREALRVHGFDLEHLLRYRAQSVQLQSMRPDSKPYQCNECGKDLGRLAATGRPRAYCGHACRQAAYRHRKATT